MGPDYKPILTPEGAPSKLRLGGVFWVVTEPEDIRTVVCDLVSSTLKIALKSGKEVCDG
jgi:hypothetical protein